MPRFIVSDQTNPYLNIAVENHLLAQPDTGEPTLYLWRNRRTVVIGQNQNPYSECNLEALTADGGYLMRRRTGGGAVYHDDGNLNFSFIVPKPLYDQQRQFSVLQRAVASFGIRTEVSGRNDVLAYSPADGGPDGEGGRKFSGNAFSKGRHQDLHHGTILIKGNMADLQRYLKPKPAKLQKHGVSSVRSRVVNLSELNPDITPDTLAPRLEAAFAEVYGSQPERVDFSSVARTPEVQALAVEFASVEWLYGRWRTFQAQRKAHFAWGEVELGLTVDQSLGCITDLDIASDSLDLEAIEQARRLLTGADIHQRPQPAGSHPVVDDILSLVY